LNVTCMTAPNNTSSLWRWSSNSPAPPNPTRYQPLLTEASALLQTAIAEIRRLAHGIHPPLLVSGGLAEALPALAARAPVPVPLNLQGRMGHGRL
jgi:signal transduction histidine kinase